jgi:flagellar basal-body rod protein FlgB
MDWGAEAVTGQLLRIALDASAMRHQAVASNIANAQSEGYRAKRLDFEKQLASARDLLLDRTQVANATTALANIRPAVTSSGGQSQAVRIDEQMAMLAMNTLHYQALTTALNKKIAIMAAAISGGNR